MSVSEWVLVGISDVVLARWVLARWVLVGISEGELVGISEVGVSEC